MDLLSKYYLTVRFDIVTSLTALLHNVFVNGENDKIIIVQMLMQAHSPRCIFFLIPCGFSFS